MPGSASVATGRLARISYILGSEPSPGDQLLLHPVADLDVPDVGTFHGGARMSDTRPRVWLISLSARLMGPRMCPILARRGHSPPGRFLAEVRAAGLGNKDLTTATDSQLLNIGTDECGALSAANGNGIAGYSRLIDSLMKTARNRPHTRQRSCWTRPSGAFARRTATCPHLVHRDGLTAHAVDAPLASAGGRSQVLRGCGRRHGMSP